MASLRELCKIERGYMDSMANVEAFVENFNAPRDRVRIASRLEHLETLFKEFRNNRAKIETRQEQDLKLSAEEGKEEQLKKDVEAGN